MSKKDEDAFDVVSIIEFEDSSIVWSFSKIQSLWSSLKEIQSLSLYGDSAGGVQEDVVVVAIAVGESEADAFGGNDGE